MTENTETFSDLVHQPYIGYVFVTYLTLELKKKSRFPRFYQVSIHLKWTFANFWRQWRKSQLYCHVFMSLCKGYQRNKCNETKEMYFCKRLRQTKTSGENTSIAGFCNQTENSRCFCQVVHNTSLNIETANLNPLRSIYASRYHLNFSN